MADIVISGWYGYGNLGDEVILSSIVHGIREEYPGARLKVLSFDPGFTRSYHALEAAPQPPCGIRSWVRALASGRCAQTCRAVAGSDILLLGGGGFLSDWQPEAPWVWLRQALFARLMGKRVLLYGIGAGPFTRPFGSFVTRSIINRCVHGVTVRDEESRRWLLQAGVRRELVTLSADPALNYPVAPSSRAAGSPVTVGICVAPVFHLERHWPGKRQKYERYLTAMSQLVDRLLGEGYRVVFIPMQPDSDLPFAREIIGPHQGKVEIATLPQALDAAVSQLGTVDILVTMRFHAALLGALQGVPVAGIIYHHKVAQFLEAIGMADYAEELGDGSNWRESDIDPGRLMEKIKRIEAEYPQVAAAMEERVARLKEREKGNLRALAQAMGGRR